jgi:hypothetical protein
VDGTVKVNLSAEGFPSALSFDGKIEGRGLTRRFENGSSPPSQFDATMQGADGTASFTGELASPGLSPLILKAETPFGIVKAVDGSLHWMNPEGRFSASLEIPKVDMGILRPLFPNIQRLEGLLSGSLAVTGTVGKPMLDGHLMISGGRLEISSNAPLISNVNGALTFGAAGATLEEFTGEMGEGLLKCAAVLRLKTSQSRITSSSFTVARFNSPGPRGCSSRQTWISTLREAMPVD